MKEAVSSGSESEITIESNIIGVSIVSKYLGERKQRKAASGQQKRMKYRKIMAKIARHKKEKKA
jgi:hypothetical protein